MQTLLIILLFLAAIGYMGFRAFRTLSRKEAGCGKGCGCSTDVKPSKAM